MLSGSRMDQASACIASVVLPQADHINEPQEKGSDLHAFLCSCLTIGRDEALLLVPEKHRDAAESIDLARLPISDPSGWAGEVALAYRWGDDTARELGRNIGRDYRGVNNGEIPITVDVLGLTDELAVALDWKTGRTAVKPARENGQLRLGALAACRAYGRSRARVGIVRLFPDGGSWIDWADFDEMDIDSIALEVRQLGLAAEKARVAFETRKEMPKVVEGQHCSYCHAFAWCPAKTRLALQLAVAPQEIDLQVAQLTDEQAGVALERMRAVRDLLERVEASLKERARMAPIPLSNGNRYAQVEVQREGLRADVVLDVLTQLHGSETARKAVEMKTSKTAVEKVLREIAKARKDAGQKTTIKAVVGEAMDAVRAAEGVYSYTSLQVREVKAEPGTDG